MNNSRVVSRIGHCDCGHHISFSEVGIGWCPLCEKEVITNDQSQPSERRNNVTKFQRWKTLREQKAERKAYIKSKACIVCQHFCWFHGSAGVCEAKSGCATTRMKDVSDVCDCGCFIPNNVRW